MDTRDFDTVLDLPDRAAKRPGYSVDTKTPEHLDRASRVYNIYTKLLKGMIVRKSIACKTPQAIELYNRSNQQKYMLKEEHSEDGEHSGIIVVLHGVNMTVTPEQVSIDDTSLDLSFDLVFEDIIDRLPQELEEGLDTGEIIWLRSDEDKEQIAQAESVHRDFADLMKFAEPVHSNDIYQRISRELIFTTTGGVEVYLKSNQQANGEEEQLVISGIIGDIELEINPLCVKLDQEILYLEDEAAQTLKSIAHTLIVDYGENSASTVSDI